MKNEFISKTISDDMSSPSLLLRFGDDNILSRKIKVSFRQWWQHIVAKNNSFCGEFSLWNHVVAIRKKWKVISPSNFSSLTLFLWQHIIADYHYSTTTNVVAESVVVETLNSCSLEHTNELKISRQLTIIKFSTIQLEGTQVYQV